MRDVSALPDTQPPVSKHWRQNVKVLKTVNALRWKNYYSIQNDKNYCVSTFFRHALKTGREGAEVTCWGRPFEVHAAATENARSRWWKGVMVSQWGWHEWSLTLTGLSRWNGVIRCSCLFARSTRFRFIDWSVAVADCPVACCGVQIMNSWLGQGQTA